MTWTYGGDPTNSNRDAVRFLVGDTDTNDQLITDEEISYLLSSWGGVFQAASKAARAIAAKFSRQVDKSVGDLKQSLSRRSENYLRLANSLEAQAAAGATRVYAGAITISDKEAVEEDEDRVQPRFKRGQFSEDQRHSDPDADWFS